MLVERNTEGTSIKRLNVKTDAFFITDLFLTFMKLLTIKDKAFSIISYEKEPRKMSR